MVDMIADKRFKYRGRQLQPGDPFTPSRAHGRVLAAVGRAHAAGGTYTAPSTTPREKRQPAADPLDRDRDGKRGGSLPHNPPSLKGKSRAKLEKIAKAERVTIPADADTNAKVIAAIEAHRAAAGVA